VPDEHSLIEIFREDGASTQQYGEGRFLVTDLDNYAMPIIRYLNGDAGKLSPPSGAYPFTRIERLDGRCNSLLLTDTGELISGVISTRVFRSTTTVERFQIIQEEPLRINIRILPKTKLADTDRELILELFSRYLGSRMKIIIETVSDLPVPVSGKSVFVINRCLESSFGFSQKTSSSSWRAVDGG
jgi:phenylacetate-CoA ligase